MIRLSRPSSTPSTTVSHTLFPLIIHQGSKVWGAACLSVASRSVTHAGRDAARPGTSSSRNSNTHLYENLESAKLVASAGRAQLMTAHWLARRPSAGMLECRITFCVKE